MVVYGYYINNIYSIIDIRYMDLYYQYLNQIGMIPLWSLMFHFHGLLVKSPPETRR